LNHQPQASAGRLNNRIAALLTARVTRPADRQRHFVGDGRVRTTEQSVGDRIGHSGATDAIPWQRRDDYANVLPPIEFEGFLFMPLRRVFGFVLLVLLTRCAPSKADCNLTMIAQMPLQVQDHLLVVPADLNAARVSLVVDSGAERTTISDAVAERLGLPHNSRYRTRSLGIGGRTVTTDVDLDRLVLGGVNFPIERAAVGTFRLQNERGLQADGLLGADVLLAFDMDIDVPGGKLTLYRARHCAESGPPWQEPAVQITGVATRKDRLLLPFELDGQSGMAILDTGAGRNVIGLDMARRMGLNEQTMGEDAKVRQRGVGPAEAIGYLHRFNLLRIGSTAETAPLIAVQLSDAGIGDALIGEPFLHGRRVWISFQNRQVFVSRRGEDR